MAISEHLLQAVKLNLASIKNIWLYTNILSYRYRKRLGLVKFGSAAPTGLVQSQVFSSLSSDFVPNIFALSFCSCVLILWDPRGKGCLLILLSLFWKKQVLQCFSNKERQKKRCQWDERKKFAILETCSLRLGGLCGTEEAFVLPTQQPRVRIKAKPWIFLISAA